MMIEQYFPLFEEGRILKKEALDAVRDYAADYTAIWYRNYGDGVIEGFKIQEYQGGILVGAGILKDGGICFLMKEAVELAYDFSGERMLVVLQRLEQHCSSDFRTDRYTLKLVPLRELKEGEYELGRFRLEKGAKLRIQEDYKDIRDAVTEFNTLNLVHVRAACEGGITLSNVLLRLYARDLLKFAASTPLDLAFAVTCLNSRQISKEFLWQYLTARCQDMIQSRLEDNLYCYDLLQKLYSGLQQGSRMGSTQGNKSGKTLID